MIYLIKFLSVWLLPPGIFILLCLALAWCWRSSRGVRFGLLFLGLWIWLFSIPIFSDSLVGMLETRYPVPARPQGDVVVLLGGGVVAGNRDVDGLNTFSGPMANRSLTAIRLALRYVLPILYSGGEMCAGDGNQAALVKRYVMSFGIPVSRFFVENGSLNTTQSVRMMLPILQREGWKRPIVVTSAFHLERSVRIFQAYGVTVEPWPCDFRHSIGRPVTYADFLPSAGALETATIAMREVLGILSLWTPYAAL